MLVEIDSPTTTPVMADGVRPPLLSRMRRTLTPLLYLSPAVALLIIWVYKPLAETVGLSFYRWPMTPTAPKVPVGTRNYTSVVEQPELHRALTNTAYYIAAFLVFSLVLPVVIALLGRTVGGRAKNIYQAMIFVPFLITPVAGCAVWRWLFAPDSGLIAKGADAAGVDVGNVFRDPNLAILGVMVIVGWQMVGFGVLVVSAGLTGINPDYAAAAAVDGASGSMITRRITLPLLSPTLVFLAMMTILLGAQWAYPVIDVLTQGGPSTATTNIYYLLYELAFHNFDAGLSAAAGTLFFLGFAAIAYAFVRISDRLSHFDD